MDWMQLLTSFVSISIIGLAAYIIFPKAKDLTAEWVRENYLRYSPDALQQPPIISVDKKTALVPTKGPTAELGILTTRGIKVVCRTLIPCSDLKWTFKDDLIILKHSDFTQPSVTFHFSDTDLELAKTVIQSFTGTKGTINAV